MNQLMRDILSLKTHAPKRFWVSMALILLAIFIPSSGNLLTHFFADVAILSGFLQKFHFLAWDVILVSPFLLLWKHFPLRRSILIWTALLNVIFLHSYYMIHGVVIILALVIGWALPILYLAMHLLRVSYQHLKIPLYRKYLLISVFCWVLFALSYPPLPLGPLAFVVFIPWLHILTRVNRSWAMTLSFWSGFVHNAMMYYWIQHVIAVGPGAVVAIGLGLLLSWFALFSVFQGFLFRRAWRMGRWSLLFFPLAWVSLEVLRSVGEISFPWAHVAYTLGNWDELIQISAWLGAYGLGFLIIFTNALGLRLFHKFGWNLKGLCLGIIAPILIITGLYLQGMFVLSHADMSGEKAKVTLIQPSILQSKKWDKNFYQETIETTMSLLKRPENRHQDLLVLPETAIPNYIRFASKERREIRRIVKSYTTEVFVGVLDFDKKGPPGRIYNFYNTGKYFSIDDSYKRGTKVEEKSYSKIRLVPFSEKLPWDDVFPVLNYVNLGEGDFRPGKETPIYSRLNWAPNICYETIYPDFVRQNIRSGARLIVNITNDGWFQKSTAPYQHLNLVKFRAAENGIPVARSANTGVSAFIDQYGRIRKQTKIFESTLIQDEIPLKTRTTLYSQIGDVVEEILFWLFWLLLLAAIWYGPQRLKNRS
jgi:apolipoprotein N-acyltransferase